jgi:hypothetical protein
VLFSSPHLDPPKSGGENTQKHQKTPFFEKPHEVPWKMAKNPKNPKKPQKWPKTQKTRKSEFWCIKGATKQRSFLSTPPHLISL